MRRLSQGVDRDSQTGQIVEWNSKRFGLRTYISDRKIWITLERGQGPFSLDV
jgi:hypothetical protein